MIQLSVDSASAILSAQYLIQISWSASALIPWFGVCAVVTSPYLLSFHLAATSSRSSVGTSAFADFRLLSQKRFARGRVVGRLARADLLGRIVGLEVGVVRAHHVEPVGAGRPGGVWLEGEDRLPHRRLELLVRLQIHEHARGLERSEREHRALRVGPRVLVDRVVPHAVGVRDFSSARPADVTRNSSRCSRWRLRRPPSRHVARGRVCLALGGRSLRLHSTDIDRRLPLLHHVRQLVRQQGPPFPVFRCELVRTKHNLGPYRVGVGVHIPCRLLCGRAGMHTHPGKVVTEALLHGGASRRAERLTG